MKPAKLQPCAARFRALQQEQAPLADQLTQLQTENERLSNPVAQAKDSRTLPPAQLNELLRLRAKATAAQADARELARLKATPTPQTGQMPEYLTKKIARGMSIAEEVSQKSALARLSRMKTMLHLADDQERAIGNIMTNRITRNSQLRLDLITGKLTPEQEQAQALAMGDQEAEIKALLTPEQLAAYPEFQQAEKTTLADSNARFEASQLAGSFSLPQDQQEKLRGLLYESNLKEPDSAPSQRAIAEVNKSGKLADAVSMSVQFQKWQLEEKLKILAGFVSPEQMTAYRQEQKDRIDNMAGGLKMLPAQEPTEATN